MRETTQMDNERYRWIPNTGEYLELRDINVYIRSKTGVDVTNGNVKIQFAGLKDRDYNLDTSGTNGNIYKNKAEKFMVKLYGNGQEAELQCWRVCIIMVIQFMGQLKVDLLKI